AGPRGVELDVAAAVEKITRAADRRGPITALPQGPAPPAGGIDISDVAPAKRLHRAGQAGLVGGGHEEMQVVVHQDIGVDGAVMGCCRFAEPCVQAPVIVLAKEDRLAVVAAGSRAAADRVGNSGRAVPLKASVGAGKSGLTTKCRLKCCQSLSASHRMQSKEIDSDP